MKESIKESGKKKSIKGSWGLLIAGMLAASAVMIFLTTIY